MREAMRSFTSKQEPAESTRKLAKKREKRKCVTRRTDYPESNDSEWLKHIVLTMGEAPEDVKLTHRDIITR